MNIKSRVENALWGAFIGDSLAMPVHWFYSTERIRACFPEGIDGYKAAPHPHPDAFMLGMEYKPDVDQATALGRPFDILHGNARFYRTTYSHFEFDLSEQGKEHGNRTATENQRMHYHHGLCAGASTLGASLLRVLMRSVIKRDGYSQTGFLDDFIAYMTVPRDNPDPYTEIYLRRWFEHYSRGVAPENCADHQRRTWSIGSLGGVIRPLALALLNWSNTLLASGMALSHQQLTHRSELVSGAVSTLVPGFLATLQGTSWDQAFEQWSGCIKGPATSGTELFQRYRDHKGPGNIPDQTMWLLHMMFKDSSFSEESMEHYASACYIEHGLPLLIDIAQQHNGDLFASLKANAEAGGDCVHRGMVMGLLLGAATDEVPEHLRAGLQDAAALSSEISAFAEIAATGRGHLLI